LPPEPWQSFLCDIDEALEEPVVLHCLGGFVIAMQFGLPRGTVDVDFLSITPVQETCNLEMLAGEGSPSIASMVFTYNMSES